MDLEERTRRGYSLWVNKRRLVCALLVISIAGCGTPFYVTTEPRQAELYVDGRFVGIGAATVPTNGIVFNSYHVEARDKQGKVLGATDVDVEFGARSAVLAGVGLIGILLWPLLPLIPAAFFVGEPDPERVHIRVPLEEKPAPPPPDEMDRPVIDFAEPGQGEQISASSDVTVRGVARHWSGIETVEIELDGKRVHFSESSHVGQERAFTVPIKIEDAGSHVIRVTVKPVRGAPGVEEVRVTRIK